MKHFTRIQIFPGGKVPQGFPSVTLSSFRVWFILILIWTMGIQDRSHAETDLYSFPEIEEWNLQKAKKRPVDPFAKILSKKMSQNEADLDDAIKKGFGRLEIIRIILISEKSKKPLKELFKKREDGTRLAQLAKNNGLANREIRRQAGKIKKELEKNLKKAQEESANEKKKIAGVSETLTKNGTGYSLLDPSDPDRKK